MDIIISAKHMELTPALKSHVDERMVRLKKYTDQNLNIEVYLGVEKYRKKIHAVVKGKGFQLNSEAEEPDSMYKAIDMCVDKLEKQLRRGKHQSSNKSIDKESVREGKTADESLEGYDDAE